MFAPDRTDAPGATAQHPAIVILAPVDFADTALQIVTAGLKRSRRTLIEAGSVRA